MIKCTHCLLYSNTQEENGNGKGGGGGKEMGI